MQYIIKCYLKDIHYLKKKNLRPLWKAGPGPDVSEGQEEAEPALRASPGGSEPCPTQDDPPLLASPAG